MAIKIRKAIKADCAAMMALIHELAVYEKCPEQVTVSMEHFIESGFGTQPIWHAYIACIEDEEEEKIIGLALYYIRYSTWKGQRLYIEDLIVTEQSRGLGVGKLLFDQLITVAAENKFSGIVWQVLDWNEPAINFYKKFPLATFDNGWVNCSINF